MPNVASVLKDEISRVARKAARSETQSLKKSVTTYRAQIAQLKRRADALERQVARLAKLAGKGGGKAAAAAAGADEENAAAGLRFSPKGLVAQRKRLGLTVAEMAKLLGVSGVSVYKWETGQTRPRDKQLPTIAAVRRMGRRDAAARLAA